MVFNYLTGTYENVKKSKPTYENREPTTTQPLTIKVEENLTISSFTDEIVDLTSDNEEPLDSTSAREDDVTLAPTTEVIDLDDGVTCHICSYKAPKKQQLEIHIYKSHLANSYSLNFLCKLCPFESNIEREVGEHEASHTNKEVLEDIGLSEHIQVVPVSKKIVNDAAKKKLFKCYDCNYVTENKSCLYAHTKKHKRSKFKCELHREVCEDCKDCIHAGYILKGNKELDKRDEIDKKYLCFDCNKFSSDHRSSLRRHVQHSHKKSRFKCDQHIIFDYQCKACFYGKCVWNVCTKNITINNGVYVKKHERSKFKCKLHREVCEDCKACIHAGYILKGNKERDEIEKDYLCFDCMFSSNHRYSLQRHVQHSHKESRFKCDQHIIFDYQCKACFYGKCVWNVCTKNITINNGVYVKKHKRSKFKCKLHREVCDDCKDCIYAGYILGRDKRLKTEKKYLCFECKFSSNRRSSLQKHVKCFHKESRFKCKQHKIFLKHCKACFYEKRMLKNVSQEVYECFSCDFRSVYKNNLYRHINKCGKQRSTPRDKVYKCSDCNFSTSFRFSLSRHMKKCHNKNFKCFDCSFTSRLKSELVKHVCRHKDSKFSCQTHLTSNNVMCAECIYQTILNDVSNNPFLCFDCVVTFKELSELEEHVQFHKDSQFKCDDHDSFNKDCSLCVYKLLLEMSKNDMYECSYCGYGYQNLFELERHLTHTKGNCSDPESLYKCLECNFKAANKTDFLIHVRTHKGSGFTCEEHSVKKDDCCKCVYDGWLKHCSSILKEAKWICFECDFKVDNYFSLSRHVNMHKSSFICPMHTSVENHCLFCFYQSLKIKVSKSTNNITINNGVTLLNPSQTVEIVDMEIENFICSQCDYYTTDSKLLKIHEQEAHLEAKGKFSCFDCDFKGENLISLQNHSLEHRPSKFTCFSHSCPIAECPKCVYQNCLENLIFDAPFYECTHCGFKTGGKKSFFNHRRSQTACESHLTPSVNYKCYDCPYTNQNKEMLLEHAMIHKTDESTCNARSNTGRVNEKDASYILERDKRLKTEKKYLCFECKFSSNRRSSLQKHVKCFHKESKFKCNRHKIFLKHCKACFYEKRMIKNVSQEVYECFSCDFSSVYKNNLYRHINKCGKQRSTPRDKVYKCSDCNFSTSFRFSLSRHMKKCHNKNFKCFDCSFTSRLKSELVKHVCRHKDSKFSCQTHLTSNNVMCAECIYQTILNDVSNNPFLCFDCVVTFKELSELEEHVQFHKDSQFKCDYHDSFNKDCSLCVYKLLLEMSKNDMYECSYCGYGYQNLFELERHLTHTKGNCSDPESLYKCLECNFKAANKTDFLIHVRTHKGSGFTCEEHSGKEKNCYKCVYEGWLKQCSSILKEAKWICFECDFKVDNYFSLSRHVNMHKSSFICPMHTSVKNHCLFCFYQSLKTKTSKCTENITINDGVTLLNPSQTVEIVDMDIENFICSQCDYYTTDSKLLKIHEQEAHLEAKGKFSCFDCDFKGEDLISLQNHSLEHGPSKFTCFSHSIPIAECPKCVYQNCLENLIFDAPFYECTHCGFKTGGKKSFFNHRRSQTACESHLTPSVNYKCYDCPYTNQNKEMLLEHAMIHKTDESTCNPRSNTGRVNEKDASYILERDKRLKTETKYLCFECKFSSNRRSSLQKHVKCFHKESKFKCNRHKIFLKHCKACFYEKRMIKNVSQEVYECFSCDFSSVYKNNLYRHINKCGKQRSTPRDKVYKCSDCNFSTSFRFSLSRHMKKCHNKNFKCFDCSFTSRLKSELVKHVCRHKDSKFSCQTHLTSNNVMCAECIYQTILNDVSNNPFLCFDCVVTFKELSELEEHVQFHKDSQFKCDDHDSFNKDCSLCVYKLLLEMSKNDMYECFYCGYGYQNLFELERHLTRTKGNCSDSESLYKCLECNFKAANKTDFLIHVRTHKGSGFTCEEHSVKKDDCCKCVYEGWLKQCSSILKEAKWICFECDFKVDNYFSLSRHVNMHKSSFICPMHTSVKNHCLFCFYQSLKTETSKCTENITINDGVTLLNPSQTVEIVDMDIENFICSQCHYYTTDSKLLKIHEQEAHLEAKGKFSCFDCDFKGEDLISLQNHSLEHGPSKFTCFSHSIPIAECPKCVYQNCLENLIFDAPFYECTHCGFKTGGKKLFFNHRRSQTACESQLTPSVNYKCYDCPYTNQNKEMLLEHAMIHKTDESTCNARSNTGRVNEKDVTKVSQQMYECFSCGFRSVYKRNLSTHIKRCCKRGSTLQDKVYKCLECNFSTSIRFSLLGHTKECHNKNFKCDKHTIFDNSCETCVYECFDCSFTSRLKSELVKHVRHHKDSKFSCQKHVRSNSVYCTECIYQTILNDVSNNPFLCFDCVVMFKEMSELEEHIQLHKDRQFKCDDHDSFNKGCSLCVYKLLLEMCKNDMYECSYCGYGYPNVFELERHLTHTNGNCSDSESLYKCLECNFKATNKIDFLIHLRTHKDSGFTCLEHSVKKDDCCKCVYEGWLKQCSSILKEAKWICFECDFIVDNYFSLSLHVKIHKSSFVCPMHTSIKNHCLFCFYQSLKIKTSKCTENITIKSSVNLLKSKSEKPIQTDEIVEIDIENFKCSQCSYETTDSNLLKIHEQEGHLEAKGKFSCFDCNFKGENVVSLQNHSLEHRPSKFTCFSHSIPIAECQKCVYQNCLENLIFDAPFYECSHCRFNTGEKYSFLNHRRNQTACESNLTPSVNYKCYYCSYTNQNKEMLLEHAIIHKTDESTCNARSNKGRINEKDVAKVSQQMYKCSNCDFRSVRKGNLSRHIKESCKRGSTLEDKVYKCLDCNYSTSFSFSLLRHTKECHNKNFKNDKHTIFDSNCETCIYECFDCSFTSRLKLELVKHVRHHKNSKFSCQEHVRSSSVYCTKCIYQTILNDVSNNPFLCFDCVVTFKQMSELEEHIQLHKDSQFKCDDHDSFNKDCSLCVYKLLLEMSKNDMYECSYCGYGYQNLFELERHLTHFKGDCSDSESLYKCLECNFKAKNKTGFLVHVRTHKDSGFTCEEHSVKKDNCCKCVYEGWLKQCSSILKEAQWFCVECDFKVDNYFSLSRHVNIHNSSFFCPMHTSIKNHCSFCFYQSLKTKTSKCTGNITSNNGVTMLKPKSEKPTQTDEIVEMDIENFSCTECRYETTDSNLLKIHEQEAHFEAKVKFSCFDCDFKGENVVSLQNHSLAHRPSKFTCFSHSIPIAECPKCVYQNCLENLIFDAPFYECSHCRFKSGEKNSFLNHRRSQTACESNLTASINYRCYDCSYRNQDKDMLLEHAVIHKNSEFTCNAHSNYELDCVKCIYEECLEKLKDTRKDSKILTCKCGYSTKWRVTFNKHQSSCGQRMQKVTTKESLSKKPTTYKCYHCNFTTKSKSDLKFHAVNHYKEVFECPDKNSHSFCRKCIYQDILKEVNRDLFYCSRCQFKTFRERTFSRHSCEKLIALPSNPDEERNKREFQCSHCQFKTFSQTALSKHNNKNHPQQITDAVKCSICNVGCKDFLALVFHKNIAHSEIFPANCLNCPECDEFTTYQVIKLKEHSITHQQTSVFCEKHSSRHVSNISNSNLQLGTSHNESATNKDTSHDESATNNDYACCECLPKYFDKAAALQLHINTHHKESTYYCPVHSLLDVYCKQCIYQYAIMSAKLEKCICKFCSYKAANLEDVLIHMKGNCNEMVYDDLPSNSYKCYTCGSFFETRLQLWDHSSSHTSDYKCVEHDPPRNKRCCKCFFSYIMKIRNGIKCMKCNSTLKTEYHFKAHIEAEHRYESKCKKHKKSVKDCEECLFAAIQTSLIGKFKCNMCDKEFCKFTEHYHQKHPNCMFKCDNHPFKKDPLECALCYIEIICMSDRVTQIACYDCDYRCDKIEDLELHVNIFHSNSSFCCSKHSFGEEDSSCNMCVYEFLLLKDS